MSTKRSREPDGTENAASGSKVSWAELPPRAAAAPDLSTLSVYTYHGPLVTHFVPASQIGAALPSLLSAVFGQRVRHSVFSFTSTPGGDFLMLDEALHRELFGGGDARAWSCIYIHEGSTERTGADLSGALSTLCDQLARARIAVLNVCTLARNFMIVRDAVADKALATLRSALEAPPPPPPAAVVPAAPTAAEADSTSPPAPPKGVRIELQRASVAIGTLSVEQLKGSSCHALLSLLFLRIGTNRPSFTHYFEMGGETSIILEEEALEKLRSAEPSSAQLLDATLEPSLTRGWRVLSVTAPAGSDGVGILGAVCLPLATLPLMNVSTLDHTFVLLPQAHVEEALLRLAPHFELTRE